MSQKILVVGSINVDLVARAPQFPLPGQTKLGTSFAIFPGGKGANQTVAAKRLGAEVSLLGMIGNDAFARIALDQLENEGVNTACIGRAPSSTGVAVIEVDDTGENHMIYVPGANDFVDIAYIQNHISLLNACDYLLLQLEIPLETVEWAAKTAHSLGKIVVLDPAPVKPLSRQLIANIDIITPNQNEVETLSGKPASTESEAAAAAKVLLDLGVRAVVNKSGARGVFYSDKDGTRHIQGFSVDAADTTAAGDSFNAGLVASLAEGFSMEESLIRANAVGALSTTKAGAQSAMPLRAELDMFLDSAQTCQRE